MFRKGLKIMFTGRSARLSVNSKTWNPTQTEWLHAAQCIQEEEKLRIGKFVFKRDAKSAMVGRLLLRYGVSKFLGVPSRSLQFDRTEKGKPYLLSSVDRQTARCDLSFNISHQGDLVVFAAENNDRIVGVDIMKVEWIRNKPITDFFSTMERQLTEQEWAEVKKRHGDLAQLKTFYRFWCLKESLVKALGTGIGFEVNRLNFNLHTAEVLSTSVCEDTTVDIDGQPAEEWTFQETMLTDHCVAVAMRGSKQDGENDFSLQARNPDEAGVPTFHTLNIEHLLAGCDTLKGSEPDKDYWEAFSARREDPSQR